MGAEFENLGVPSDAERPSPTATAEFARIRTVDVGLKIEFRLRADPATYPRNRSRLQFTGGWFTYETISGEQWNFEITSISPPISLARDRASVDPSLKKADADSTSLALPEE